MSIFRKEKRTIYGRKIKGLFEDFRANRIGFVGIILLIIYVVVAILAPYVAPYPIENPPRTGTRYAMPQWVTIFPQFKELPPTMRIELNWTLAEEYEHAQIEYGEEIVFTYRNLGSLEPEEINLKTDFDYDFVPPREFQYRFRFKGEFENLTYLTGFWIRRNVDGEEWTPIGKKFDIYTMSLVDNPDLTDTRAFEITATSGAPDMRLILFYDELYEKYREEGLRTYAAKSKAYTESQMMEPAQIFFANKSSYSLFLRLFITPKTEDATLTLRFSKYYIPYSPDTNHKFGEFTIPGSVTGILGTNSFGQDVFTQLLYGARISLMVGLLAAVISTSLGILFGVISGYLGGLVDELTMRTVDVLLCLPVLPLLLTLISYFQPNVYYIVLIIAIFGWQGLSRVIRSRVLSIREMPFVESAKAAGASDSYIIIRHLVPNIFPVAMASMILAVPAAILTEAALSFLGFGDPMVPTWGKMLHEAYSEGAFGALAWWYILPPGLAITFICLAFVFIGHALDEIVNPRLRRRR